MRGKGRMYPICEKCDRITPAYAGKRASDVQRSISEQGSPPPMRGKVYSLTRFSSCSRITPAYAGKSLGSILIRSHIQDHPRLCGEKRTAGRLENQYSGSPPPMRGKGGSYACYS